MVVGSSLKDMGGIVTVIRNIENSRIAQEYELSRLETYITGSVIAKLAIFLNGAMRFLWRMFFKRPELVHIHMAEKGSFYRKMFFILTSRVFNVPTIVHIHAASFDEFYRSSRFQMKVCDYVLRKVNKLIVLSNYWKDYFSSIVPEERIEVLYNGVFYKEPCIKAARNEPTCLFLGRLGERKGTYDLLQAIRILKQRGVRAQFLLAGDGQMELTEKKIEEYGIGGCTKLLGWIDGKQKEELLQNADALVLPSYNEGLPMAILEAMNECLPVISTTVGSIPEVIVNGENGFLIQPGDIEELARSLQDILLNEELRNRMGKANNQIISERFDLNNLMGKLSSVYRELLSSPKKEFTS
nr:glycosyltransferase family 4 protein [Paenibacillus soyae]